MLVFVKLVAVWFWRLSPDDDLIAAQVHQHLYDWLLLRKCLEDARRGQTIWRVYDGKTKNCCGAQSEEDCGVYMGLPNLTIMGDDGAPTSFIPMNIIISDPHINRIYPSIHLSIYPS